MNPMRPGTVVQIVVDGQQGTLEGIGFTRFAPETVTKGDRGTYWGTHPDVPDWHIVEFETEGGTRYCPLHRSAFREWRPNPLSSPGTDGLARLLP